MFDGVRTMLGGAIRRVAGGIEPRELSVDQRLRAALQNHVGNASGVTITPDSALSFAAYYAAVNVIATDLACLPLRPYKRLGSGGRALAPQKAVDELLHTSPDGDMTAMGFRQSLWLHVLTRGNGFAEIEFTNDGEPGAIHLLPAGSTKAERAASGRVYYPLAGGKTLPAGRVLHVSNIGWDGLNGVSTLKLHAQAVGLGKAQETTGAASYGNGNRPGGFIKSPKALKDEAIKNLLASFEGRHKGPESAFRVGLLEQGMDFQAVGMSLEDAQYIEARRFQVAEMARIFRVPPHKIGDYSDAHLANIEAANLDYLTTTLMPWLVKFEQAANLRLFTPKERRMGYYAKHNMSAFLRGDMAARAEFYSKMFALGMSVDEIREYEEQNPLGDALGGTKHFVPLNFITLDKAGNEPVSHDATKRVAAPVAA